MHTSPVFLKTVTSWSALGLGYAHGQCNLSPGGQAQGEKPVQGVWAATNGVLGTLAVL